MAERDIFTRPGNYRQIIEQRMNAGKRDHVQQFGVIDVAAIFEVSDTVVREWIEEGRVNGVNLNHGRTVTVGVKVMPMRPYWRVTREDILALAERMQAGY